MTMPVLVLVSINYEWNSYNSACLSYGWKHNPDVSQTRNKIETSLYIHYTAEREMNTHWIQYGSFGVFTGRCNVVNSCWKIYEIRHIHKRFVKYGLSLFSVHLHIGSKYSVECTLIGWHRCLSSTLQSSWVCLPPRVSTLVHSFNSLFRQVCLVW